MKINSINIVKRVVSAVVTAVAISALYVGAVSASTNTITSSEVSLGDTFTINAGYYEGDTVIHIPTAEEVIARNEIPGIKKIKANYYAGGDNSGLNAGISASKTSAYVNIETTQTLNLGVNESVTLPAGYYFNDVTIRNNVKNMGSFNFSPSNSSSKSLAAGYYTGGTVSTANAYQTGYSKGIADANSKTANITYTVSHVHGEYCYPIPTGSYTSSEGHETADDGHSTVKYYSRWVTCSVCGRTFGHKSHNGWPSDDQVWGPYNAHLVNGHCTAKGYQCGKAQGTRTTKDVTTLGSGDSIVSANIVF